MKWVPIGEFLLWYQEQNQTARERIEFCINTLTDMGASIPTACSLVYYVERGVIEPKEVENVIRLHMAKVNGPKH